MKIRTFEDGKEINTEALQLEIIAEDANGLPARAVLTFTTNDVSLDMYGPEGWHKGFLLSNQGFLAALAKIHAELDSRPETC